MWRGTGVFIWVLRVARGKKRPGDFLRKWKFNIYGVNFIIKLAHLTIDVISLGIIGLTFLNRMAGLPAAFLFLFLGGSF